MPQRPLPKGARYAAFDGQAWTTSMDAMLLEIVGKYRLGGGPLVGRAVWQVIGDQLGRSWKAARGRYARLHESKAKREERLALERVRDHARKRRVSRTRILPDGSRIILPGRSHNITSEVCRYFLAELLDDRDARAAADLRTPGQVAMGDPPTGRSALDQRAKK